eukprot:814941-Amphidinium_carterae.1
MACANGGVPPQNALMQSGIQTDTQALEQRNVTGNQTQSVALSSSNTHEFSKRRCTQVKGNYPIPSGHYGYSSLRRVPKRVASPQTAVNWLSSPGAR